MPSGTVKRYSFDHWRAAETIRILERGFSDLAVRILGIDEADVDDPEKDAFGWHFVTVLPDGAAAYANRKLGLARTLPRAGALYRALGSELARVLPESGWSEASDESAGQALASMPQGFLWSVYEGGRR